MSSGSSRPPRVGVRTLAEMKARGEPIVALTAYDYVFARLVDEAGVDVILVGDSLANVVQGLDSTLPVSLEDMIYHARAVVRGARRALVVVDLPFLSYQVSVPEAIRNAGRVLKESGAQAVKLEGGHPAMADTIAALVRAGIPVMAHLGFTPQAIHALGGVRVQGRVAAEAERLRTEAQAVADAGAFALVLELVPGGLAGEIRRAVPIPTIGIGAGPDCDGQILVLHDMLGLNRDFQPKFLRRFAALGDAVQDAVLRYAEAVRRGEYPGPEHTFA